METTTLHIATKCYQHFVIEALESGDVPFSLCMDVTDSLVAPIAQLAKGSALRRRRDERPAIEGLRTPEHYAGHSIRTKKDPSESITNSDNDHSVLLIIVTAPGPRPPRTLRPHDDSNGYYTEHDNDVDNDDYNNNTHTTTNDLIVVILTVTILLLMMIIMIMITHMRVADSLLVAPRLERLADRSGTRGYTR